MQVRLEVSLMEPDSDIECLTELEADGFDAYEMKVRQALLPDVVTLHCLKIYKALQSIDHYTETFGYTLSHRFYHDENLYILDLHTGP